MMAPSLRRTADGERLVLRLGERAGAHRVDDGAGNLERAALARPEPAARPARVDQPAVDVVRRHALSEHLGVAAGLLEEYKLVRVV